MHNMSVLIVEEHHLQHEHLKALLKAEGVNRIKTSRGGQDVLQLLDIYDFDLVISKLTSSNFDAIQIIQHLSLAQRQTRVALTATPSPKILQSVYALAEMLGVEIIGIISKPFMAVSIKKLVEKCSHPRSFRRDLSTKKLAFTRKQLENAFEQDEFEAWFQPKRELKCGTITSVEALVRWNHPTSGILLPGQFLPQIKGARLDETLLFCIIKKSLEAQSAWRNNGFQIQISINFPTYFLSDLTLPDRLNEYVLNLKGVPSSLSFELTECSMPELFSCYLAGACRLRMKGFGLAQDDFGQGYSSFYNLVKAPFTELKIDRALVKNCEREKIVATALKSIIELGQKLGLKVVAEGVENYEQLQLLKELKCDAVQGFFISKALPKKPLLELLTVDWKITEQLTS